MNTKFTSNFYVREQDREKFRKAITPKKERKTVGIFCASALLYFEENNNFEDRKKISDYVNKNPEGLNKNLRNYSFTLKSVHSYLCYFFWNPTKGSLEDMDHSLDDLKSFFSYLNPKDGFNTNDYKVTNELISNIIDFSRFREEKIKVDTKWNLITSNSSLTVSDKDSIRKHSLPDSEEKSNPNQIVKEQKLHIDAEVYLKVNNVETYYNEIEPFYNLYVGREKEKDIVHRFILNLDKRSFLVITGIGGIGKTNLVSSIIKEFEVPHIYEDCGGHEKEISNFSLINFFEVLGIEYDIDLSLRKKYDLICNKIKTINRLFIIDNFHNISDQDTRKIILRLAKLSSGKVIVISRTYPLELDKDKTLKTKALRIGFLPLENYKECINNLLSIVDYKEIDISLKQIRSIYDLTEGYPIIIELILAGLKMNKSLSFLLKNLPKFDSEYHDDGSYYSSILLNNIFEEGNEEELRLLSQLSAFGIELELNLIEKLSSFKFSTLKKLTENRSFIKVISGKYKIPDLIREYVYHQLKNKEKIHEEIGDIYLDIFDEKTRFDPLLVSRILFHYRLSGCEIALANFIKYATKRFGGSRTKSFFEKDINQNIKTYEALIKLFPENVKYYSQLSWSYRVAKQWQECYNLLTKALDKFPEDLYLQMELSRYLIHHESYIKAKEILINIASKDPKNLPSRRSLYFLYTKEGSDIALKINDEIQQIEAENWSIVSETLSYYVESNQYKKAEASLFKLEKKIGRNKFFSSCKLLAEEYDRLDLYDHAISFLEEVINHHKYNINLILFLGELHEKKFNNFKAEDCYKNAIKLDKKNKYPYIRIKLAEFYLSINEETEAENMFLEAISIDKNNLFSMPRIALGKLKQSSDPKGALHWFLEALKIDSKNEYVISVVGKLFLRQNNYSSAKRKYKELLILNQKNPYAYIGLSKIYVRQCRIRKSIFIIKKALSFDENKANLHLYSQLLFNYSICKDFKNYITIKKVFDEISKASNEKKFTPKELIKNDEINLLSFYNVGVIKEKNGQLEIDNFKVYSRGRKEITANIEHNSKVFYGIYLVNGRESINFIEPYFKN